MVSFPLFFTLTREVSMLESEVFGKIMALVLMTWLYMVFKTGRL